MHILFVCTGNTCRSPMTEMIFKHLLDQYEMRNFTASSAGLAVYGESGASKYALEAVKEWDIDLSSHRSKQFTEEELRRAHLVLTMTQAHLDIIKEAFPGAQAFTLKQYVGEEGDVLDPFGGNLETYQKCRDELKRILLKLIKRLNEQTE